MSVYDKYQIVVGLEVHAQLSTKSKIFCGDSTAFGAEPNTQTSVVSLAHPGTLPVLNETALQYAIKLGIALNCTINRTCFFDRKNYFYPDLPKGYQITQQSIPVCVGGYISITTDNNEKQIRLNRIHMEEDAGKSVHDRDGKFSCIDLNRAGVPLLEIVSEPDISSGEEAAIYLTELRKIVRWIAICNGNMEEGSMRCDANVSVQSKGSDTYGTKVEIKNLNSIRNVKRAIESEAKRQIDLLEKKQPVLQQTRSYDVETNSSFPLRTKEEADDYRYFPEPDLPAIYITDCQLQAIKKSIPDLPAISKKKYIHTFGLSDYDATQLTTDKSISDLFEAVTALVPHYKIVANWLIGPLQHYCSEMEIALDEFPLSPMQLAHLIDFTEKNNIHFNVASTKLLNAYIVNSKTELTSLAQQLNIFQVADDEAINKWIEEVLLMMPEKVQEYKKGKKGLLGMFAGEVKKISKGKADMQTVNRVLLEKLNTF